MVKLNEKEMQVYMVLVDYAYESSGADVHDICVKASLTKNQVKGYLSDLAKKGLIDSDTIENDSNTKVYLPITINPKMDRTYYILDNFAKEEYMLEISKMVELNRFN